MLLCEALDQINRRLSETFQADLRKHIPEYFDALEIAAKCIEKQMELCTVLDDLAGLHPCETMTIDACIDIIDQLSIYHEEDADEAE